MSGTGIVRSNLYLKHDPGSWHPESPRRLEVIYSMLDRNNFPDMVTLNPRTATREEICLIHTPEHYDRIAGTAGKMISHLDADTQTSARSFEAALDAVGGLILLTDQVLSGNLTNGFAFVRPPGHHAEANQAMGFCLFNNIAIAAAWALKTHRLSRIMIVDWDLHHGNGTQHSFYTDPRVLYLSTHLYPFYPGTGSLNEIGRDEGRGYTLNIPLEPNQDNMAYIAIFQKVVLPVIEAYQPELILVSAGFDTHRADPMGGMAVSKEGFAAMTCLLKHAAEKVCQGRLILVLEGGYGYEGQARSVGQVLEVLTECSLAGQNLAWEKTAEPEIISRLRKVHRDFWDF